jgi:hypothetical protein
MEQRDRFDEAIKAKIGALEDEPSDRVWAGVSGAIGATRPPHPASWRIKFAAAAAVLAVVGLGYWYLQMGHSMHGALALKKKVQTLEAKQGSQEDAVRHGAHLAQSLGDSAGKPAPLPVLARQEDDALMAHAPHQVPLPARDSPGVILRTPFGLDSDPVQPEQAFADREPPVSDTALVSLPDRGGWRPDTPTDAGMEGGKAIASNSRRRIQIPGREDLDADQLRRRSGAILGFVANGANQYLGLDASYSERQSEDLKLTAFHADLGVFKIRKVKTVKQ